ncbi:MAG: hypothetical protein EBU33_06625 [Sphingobacteriia bacterium]|nr:hypothetical protein [Sphingobacteriia bacterium]
MRRNQDSQINKQYRMTNKSHQSHKTLHKFPRMGMSPDVWGPVFWATMHIATLGYPVNPTPKDHEAAIKFYESLVVMIPCPICREHYGVHLTEMPVKDVVHSRDALINWVFNVHNKVNVQLGKKEITWEDYIKYMSKLALLERVSLLRTDKNESSSLQTSMAVNTVVFLGGLALGAAAYAWYTKTK